MHAPTADPPTFPPIPHLPPVFGRGAVWVVLACLATATLLAPAAVAQQSPLTATVDTYDGSVALADETVAVHGQAPGVGAVVVVLVDPNADVVAATARVTDGGYRAAVPMADSDGRLDTGRVTALVLSPGSDGDFGLSGQGPDSPASFVQFARSLQRRGIGVQETLERLRAESVASGGSDDTAVETTFELAPARLTLDEVTPAPPGGTLVATGTTNRRPNATAVAVTATEGPSAAAFDTARTTTWGRDGRWRVDLRVPPGAAPGGYTLTASVGGVEDTAPVTIRAGTLRPTTTTRRPTTQSPTPTATTPAPPTDGTPPPTRTRRPGTPAPPNRDGTTEILVVVGTVAVVGVGALVLTGALLVVVRRHRRQPPRL